MPSNPNEALTLSAVQQAMLARFGAFARNAAAFTSSSNGSPSLAQGVALRHLDALAALGLITTVKGAYRLTAKGQTQLDWPGHRPAPAPRRPDYVPAKWECARGAPAVEHLQYKSLPVAAQIGVA